MSDYSPEDVVTYSVKGDGSRVKEAIQGVLASKIMKSMEAKKAEVAQSMFNSVSKPDGESQPAADTADASVET